MVNILMFMSSDLRSYLVSWLKYRCFKTPLLFKIGKQVKFSFCGHQVQMNYISFQSSYTDKDMKYKYARSQNKTNLNKSGVRLN